jgi:hypothetical protein
MKPLVPATMALLNSTATEHAAGNQQLPDMTRTLGMKPLVPASVAHLDSTATEHAAWHQQLPRQCYRACATTAMLQGVRCNGNATERADKTQS